jgi:acyl-coenzyme A synthetase/AMP-(fatty) acid ligase
MITDRIYEWARTQPAKTALIHNDHPCSYAVFSRAIEVTKTFFKGQNLPTGRTAVVRISNHADAWIVILSLRSIGLNTICVNSLATAQTLNVKDVACIVLSEADHAAYMLEQRSRIGVRFIVVPRATYLNIHAGDIPSPSNGTSPFGGHILYTSGTTGTYKKVLRGAQHEETRHARMATALDFNEATVRHSFDFGLWTAAGGNSEAVWHVGGCVVIDQSNDRWTNYFSHGITSSFLTPAMLRQLLHVHAAPTAPNSGCELTIGGGFLPIGLAEGAVARFGTEVKVLYSSTECSNILQSRFRSANDLYWMTPVAGRTIQAVDEEGNECSMDRQGELRVLLMEGDCSHYLDDETTSAKFFRDGYFYPGDMAIKRADGSIRVLGRVADVLNIQGQKVAAAPIEQKVQDLLGVNAACIFSLLNDDGKEELVVAIETSEAPPQSQLDRIAREFKSFEQVRFEILQEFPRTDAGMQKIRRAELRGIIVGKRGQAGGGLS